MKKPQEKKGVRVIGIDPGYGRVGWGIIEGASQNWKHVAHGCIETKPNAPLVPRLAQIARELQIIVDKYKPDCSAVEELFFYKNVTTAIQVAQARGVILLILHNSKLPVDEFTPLQIKQAVTGYGKADKKQVQKMIQFMLELKEIPKPDDAADALAVALSCGASLMFKAKTKMSKR